MMCRNLLNQVPDQGIKAGGVRASGDIECTTVAQCMHCDRGTTCIEICSKDTQDLCSLQMHYLAPVFTRVTFFPAFCFRCTDQSVRYSLRQRVKLFYPDA